jgi:2-polyprenyl-3-methyl-5-hydroxy-6-metoxy-1,4-benzoquinol methylase
MDSKTETFRRTHDFPCWCGEVQSHRVCQQMFGRRYFMVLECDKCTTHRILPRALTAAADAEKLYNEYASVELSEARQEEADRHMLRRLRAVQLEFCPGIKVLDVGCGDGSTLNAICDSYGCEGKGIDVDKRRIAHARGKAKKAEFECGLFEGKKFAGPYDVVISSAVIEHVTDPIGFLKEFGDVLKPGGSVFLLTPNAASLNYRLLRSWWRELLSIGEHIYLFTPDSLELCAKQAGFELVTASSDFDFGAFSFKFRTPRELVIQVWACYRRAIKRLAQVFSSARTGDILFMHLRKPALITAQTPVPE